MKYGKKVIMVGLVSGLGCYCVDSLAAAAAPIADTPIMSLRDTTIKIIKSDPAISNRLLSIFEKSKKDINGALTDLNFLFTSNELLKQFSDLPKHIKYDVELPLKPYCMPLIVQRRREIQGKLLAVSADSKRVITRIGDMTRAAIFYFENDTWVQEAILRHNDLIRSAQFSSDGSKIVTASYDQTAKIWRFNSSDWVQEAILQHNDNVNEAQFSPDGLKVVTASDDRTAKIWRLDAYTWAQEGADLQHNASVISAQFSTNGSKIVTSSYDNRAKVWIFNAGTWMQQGADLKHNSNVNGVQFSPDGLKIVTALEHGIAKVWILGGRDWVQEGRDLKHNNSVSSAQFSPDGLKIVTSSYDNTAKVWISRDTNWVQEAILEHNKWVASAQFSQDGLKIVTGSEDGAARVWRLNAGNWVQEVMFQHNTKLNRAQFSADGLSIFSSTGITTFQAEFYNLYAFTIKELLFINYCINKTGGKILLSYILKPIKESIDSGQDKKGIFNEIMQKNNVEFLIDLERETKAFGDMKMGKLPEEREK